MRWIGSGIQNLNRNYYDVRSWSSFSGGIAIVSSEGPDDLNNAVIPYYVNVSSNRGGLTGCDTIAVFSGDQILISASVRVTGGTRAACLFMLTPFGEVGFLANPNTMVSSAYSETSSASAFVDSNYIANGSEAISGTLWMRVFHSFVAPTSCYIVPLCVRGSTGTSTFSINPSPTGNGATTILNAGVAVRPAQRVDWRVPFAVTSGEVNSTQLNGVGFDAEKISFSTNIKTGRSVTRSGRVYRTTWGTRKTVTATIDSVLSNIESGGADYINQLWRDFSTVAIANPAIVSDISCGKITNINLPLGVRDNFRIGTNGYLGYSGTIELESF